MILYVIGSAMVASTGLGIKPRLQILRPKTKFKPQLSSTLLRLMYGFCKFGFGHTNAHKVHESKSETLKLVLRESSELVLLDDVITVLSQRLA